MRKIFTTLFILFIALTIRAQSWQDVGGGLNSSSHGMCNWNGMLIDGGSFNSPCGRVAGWDGTTWNCFGSGVGLVARDAIEFNGDLIVVGDFWNVNQPCVGCNGVARWDGTSWTPLGTGVNNDVLCATIWNGQLVIGGDFTQADGVPSDRIVVWNGTNWYSLGGFTTSFGNDVRALAVYNGELWAGGDFNNVNGCTPCDGVVKWDGTAWVGGGAGVDIPGGVDSTVRVLYVNNAENRLYLGGHFTNIAGCTGCSGVAVYDGSVWYPLGQGVNDYVRGISFYNGRIIVGGNFNDASGTPANKIAKWNYSTSTWSAMGTGMNDYVKAMGVYNGTFYAGGAFTTADGQPRAYVASWYELPNIPPTSLFTMSAATLCLGQCLDLTDQSTDIPTSWTWSFPGGTPSSSVLQNPTNICYGTPGTYNVVLTACNANGCSTSTQQITVSSTAMPNVTLNASPSSTICSGIPIGINAFGATTYTWTPATFLSATTGSLVTCTATATTTYTVSGNTSGCVGTATITITVNMGPSVSVSPTSATVCSGSVNLTASGSTSYTWAPGGSLSATTGTTVTATPTITTVYTVTATAVNGCTATATAAITVPVSAALPLVEGFENPPYLPTDWTMFDSGNDGNIWQLNTAVGGFGASAQCTWYPNNTINAPGTYDAFWTKNLDFTSLSTAQMTFDVAYCRRSNASFSDTLSVWSSVDCGQTWVQQYLKGGSTLATAPNQNGSFTPTAAQWRTETINLNSLVNSSRVLFRFRNHNRNGNNLYVDNINITGVVTAPPTPNFSMSQSAICAGGCVFFTDLSTGQATGWNWTFPGGTPASSTAQNPSNICFATPGTYTVSLSACNANGCNTATQTIVVNNCTGVEEKDKIRVLLAPNPFTQQTLMMVSGEVLKDAFLFISDMNGRVVRKMRVEDGANTITILREELRAGMYFYSLGNHGAVVKMGKMVLE